MQKDSHLQSVPAAIASAIQVMEKTAEYSFDTVQIDSLPTPREEKTIKKRRQSGYCQRILK